MGVDQLREFFREKKAKTQPANVDWAAKREAWVRAVDSLFGTISDYLRAADAAVVLTLSRKVVVEKSVGEYHISELVLRVGDEEVVFSPKGLHVVGAQGRVDVYGDRGEATIIWEGNERWSIVASRTPALQLVPLTPDSLAVMLRAIMRP
jgi:hypothetical protein